MRDRQGGMRDNQPTEQRDWSVYNMLGLLKRILNATSQERLRWGPASAWCPSGRDFDHLKALLVAGLVRVSFTTDYGATYYFPTDEAFEIFGMKPPTEGGDT